MINYLKAIKELYREELGKSIKDRLKELNIAQCDVGENIDKDTLNYISAPIISKICNGQINVTAKSVFALLDTCMYQTTKELFFPDKAFLTNLVSKLFVLILTDDCFKNSYTRDLLLQKMYHTNSTENLPNLDVLTHSFVVKHQEVLIDKLWDQIPDVPDEMTSDEISLSFAQMVAELNCLLISL